ncbi:type VII secretion protein EccB [Corynebacterium sp.]|uniref:type VII secretion protein EccB n=1 Tax=Corynebacterium sp. TaxID=1720 RepID=UPI0026DECD45|nr:type VII secretion protein EccB [Corynebacterium sp.]MDO5512747.1 type VII secretion protein EccB [Corynebacterium sp.]
MGSTVLPTTRAQVSGHRFLRRRLEHGLVFGDIRMIHDPLATRSRALLFGLVAVVLISLGAGLLAWLRPAAHPGDAPILQTADGALFVRIEDRVHPVTNLASARLITGEPAAPARIGDSLLAEADRGVPLGVHPAPVVLAAEEHSDQEWAACFGQETTTVAVGGHTNPLGGHRGVLAEGAGAEWLLTVEGRHQLPAPSLPEGRMVRRALGIGADTPRWRPPVEVLGAVDERDPVTLPELPAEILDTGAGLWAVLPDGVAPLTGVQAEVLADAGVTRREVDRQVLAEHPDAAFDLRLPAVAPLFVDPEEVTVCATEGRVSTLTSTVRPVTLSGEGVADEFRSDTRRALAVDTGHGFHIVDATGLRHTVGDRADLAALGAGEPVSAPWSVLRLLPAGPPLDRETALRASY